MSRTRSRRSLFGSNGQIQQEEGAPLQQQQQSFRPSLSKRSLFENSTKQEDSTLANVADLSQEFESLQEDFETARRANGGKALSGRGIGLMSASSPLESMDERGRRIDRILSARGYSSFYDRNSGLFSAPINIIEEGDDDDDDDNEKKVATKKKTVKINVAAADDDDDDDDDDSDCDSEEDDHFETSSDISGLSNSRHLRSNHSRSTANNTEALRNNRRLMMMGGGSTHSAGPASKSYQRNIEREQEQEHRVQMATERNVFRKAKEVLCPGALYRYIVYLYAERKLLVFFWMHFVATMVIWSHFAMIKFEEQAGKVPEGAPRYWWKRLAPPLEFGSMHAILFQMSLLPLTMSRLSVASLSESFLETVFPLNRVLRMHIHLGYTMVLIVVIATLFFFAFFGLLCSDGDQSFCDKFTSEIMITGYTIFASLIIVGVTSYARHIIPYEVFYVIHHLVFIMYFISIAHTLDIVQRSGERARSQTFKWFSSTLLYYICDRVAMHLNHKYKAKILTSSTTAVEGKKGNKMIILKVQRPSLFQFKPGQYAFLKLDQIDSTWHPFSIASSPESNNLEFYIEVVGTKRSWSGQLWKILNTRHKRAQHLMDQEALTNDDDDFFADDDDSDDDEKKKELADLLPDLTISVMGPYGTSLVKTQDFSHVLAIGAGTGIVPIVSLFKQHVRQLLKLDPTKFLKEIEERESKILSMDLAQEKRKGSLFSKFFPCLVKPEESNFSTSRDMDNDDDSDDGKESRKPSGGASVASIGSTRRDLRRATIRESIKMHDNLQNLQEIRANKKELQQAASKATRSIYGVVLLSILPILGLVVLSFAVSWNTITIALYGGMTDTLQIMTWVFQALFYIVSFFVWDGNSLFAYVDFTVCIVTPFADWYWYLQYETNGILRPVETVLFCILTGYMASRAWISVVESKQVRWKNELTERGGVTTLDRLIVVWTTRSASLVTELLPDIVHVWDSLIEAWGSEKIARKVCRIVIHVTDKDKEAVSTLQTELKQTSLFKSGMIRFERPDLGSIIEDHTLDLICTRRQTSSILAFCGSPQLAREIHELKISNDMVSTMTGNENHRMEFVSESYGGPSKSTRKTRAEVRKEQLEKRKQRRLSRKQNNSDDPTVDAEIVRA